MERTKNFLAKFETPDFFRNPADPDLEVEHTRIQNKIKNASDTLTVGLEQWLIEMAETDLTAIGWTLEESIILFVEWSVLYPDRLEAWLHQIAVEKLFQFHRPYSEKDKIEESRFQSDEFDALMDEIQRDGIKVIVDEDGKERAVIMSWWLSKAAIRLDDPEHAAERIAEIEKACAEYKDT